MSSNDAAAKLVEAARALEANVRKAKENCYAYDIRQCGLWDNVVKALSALPPPSPAVAEGTPINRSANPWCMWHKGCAVNASMLGPNGTAFCGIHAPVGSTPMATPPTPPATAVGRTTTADGFEYTVPGAEGTFKNVVMWRRSFADQWEVLAEAKRAATASAAPSPTPPAPESASTASRLASTTDPDPVQAFRDTCMGQPAPVPTAEEVAEKHIFQRDGTHVFRGVSRDGILRETTFKYMGVYGESNESALGNKRGMLAAIITADRAACSADRDRLARRVAELEGKNKELKFCVDDASPRRDALERTIMDRNATIADLRAKLDTPVCRLQFPDGSVPGNTAEAADGWYKVAQGYRVKLDEASNEDVIVERARRVSERLLKDPEFVGQAVTSHQSIVDAKDAEIADLTAKLEESERFGRSIAALRAELAEALKYGARENTTAHRRKVKCDHNDYWITVSGDCMACRAVKAEKERDGLRELYAAARQECYLSRRAWSLGLVLWDDPHHGTSPAFARQWKEAREAHDQLRIEPIDARAALAAGQDRDGEEGKGG